MIAEWITKVIEKPYDKRVLNDVRSMVHSLCHQFPIY
jgi:glycine/serine hydroxymethyltransferase